MSAAVTGTDLTPRLPDNQLTDPVGAVVVDGVSWLTETNGSALIATRGRTGPPATDRYGRAKNIADLIANAGQGVDVDLAALRTFLGPPQPSWTEPCDECDGYGRRSDSDADCTCACCACPRCDDGGVEWHPAEVRECDIGPHRINGNLLAIALDAIGARGETARVLAGRSDGEITWVQVTSGDLYALVMGFRGSVADAPRFDLPAAPEAP